VDVVSASTVFAGQDALAALLNADAAFSDCDVYVGFPPKRVVPRDLVWIQGEVANGLMTPMVSGTPVVGKDESYTLEVQILAVRATDTFLDVRAVLEARWEALEVILRTDEGCTLSNTVRAAFSTGFEIAEGVGDDGSRYALLTVRVECSAWVN
jgi:hypothetical protein